MKTRLKDTEVLIRCSNAEDAAYIAKFAREQAGNSEQTLVGYKAGILRSAIQRATHIETGKASV